MFKLTQIITVALTILMVVLLWTIHDWNNADIYRILGVSICAILIIDAIKTWATSYFGNIGGIAFSRTISGLREETSSIKDAESTATELIRLRRLSD
jgi:hypothetical protein